MRVHTYSSLPHYFSHIEPIWEALPEEVRGHQWAPRPSAWGKVRSGQEWREPGPVLVASYADARAMTGRSLVHVEHGSGQVWPACPDLAKHPGYSDGGGMERVRLFIVPGEEVAARRRARYPRAAVAAVGAAKMDRWLADPFTTDLMQRMAQALPGYGPTRTVAFTFHWHHRRCPELRSALPHYREALGPLVERLSAEGIAVLGHAHPKAAKDVEPVWRALGVEYTPDLSEVFVRADLLVADVTSAAYEFASLGRPVLSLNAPHYRREVEQGLRFWSYVPGLQCDEPADLYDRIREALTDPPEARVLRERAVAQVYAFTDGSASKRAADAIMAVLR